MDLSWDIWSNSKKTYLGYIHFSLTGCERGDPIFSCFLRFRKVECNVPSLLTLSPWWPVQKTPFDRKSHLILSYHLQDLSAILLAAIACECWDNLCRAGLNLKGTTLLSQHIVAKSDCFISCSSQDQQWHVFWGQVSSVCIIQFMKFIHQNSELPESSPPSRVYIIYIYHVYLYILVSRHDVDLLHFGELGGGWCRKRVTWLRRTTPLQEAWLRFQWWDVGRLAIFCEPHEFL